MKGQLFSRDEAMKMANAGEDGEDDEDDDEEETSGTLGQVCAKHGRLVQ